MEQNVLQILSKKYIPMIDFALVLHSCVNDFRLLGAFLGRACQQQVVETGF